MLKRSGAGGGEGGGGGQQTLYLIPHAIGIGNDHSIYNILLLLLMNGFLHGICLQNC